MRGGPCLDPVPRQGWSLPDLFRQIREDMSAVKPLFPAFTCQRLRGSWVSMVPSRTQGDGDSSSDRSQGPDSTKFPSIAPQQAGLCAHFITHMLERGLETRSSQHIYEPRVSLGPLAYLRATRITHSGSCSVQRLLPRGGLQPMHGVERESEPCCLQCHAKATAITPF